MTTRRLTLVLLLFKPALLPVRVRQVVEGYVHWLRVGRVVHLDVAAVARGRPRGVAGEPLHLLQVPGVVARRRGRYGGGLSVRWNSSQGRMLPDFYFARPLTNWRAQADCPWQANRARVLPTFYESSRERSMCS
jgi:hypothetical protein